MKTFTPPHRILTIVMLAVSCLLVAPMKAQTIQIDSTFTADGELFPFSPNDTIYGLSISGSVHLFSDTSLVRIILTDQAGQEWMVYEAYPMIVTDNAFEIEEECDETCYLEESIPYSLSVQIIDAEIEISYLSLSNYYYENLADLQYQGKRNKDLQKVQYINQYIDAKSWDWLANTNGLVNMFYYEKIQLFSTKYNLLGLDYYSAGVYYSVTYDCILPYSELTITPSFDWRKQHNANILNTFYYGGEPLEPDNGWMSSIREQVCGSCQSYATVASLEAAINLYANYQFDIDEGISFSERDAFNCSKYFNGIGCTCVPGNSLGGKDISEIMLKLINEGVVSEECYPWPDPEHPNFCEAGGVIYPDCDFSSKCEYPAMTAKICAELIFDLSDKTSQSERAAYLKELLILNGPLTITLHNWPTSDSPNHAVSLAGFDTDLNGNVVWIFKNSWGFNPIWGEAGYCSEPFWLGEYDSFYCTDPMIMNSIHAFDYTCLAPITITADSSLYPAFNYVVKDIDHDKDGYYNWGIGQKPDIYLCSQEEDSNDDDKHTGPYDDHYNGIQVASEMNVFIMRSIARDYIADNSFFSFSSDDMDENDNVKIYIENNGNAQLNLQRYGITEKGKVEIINIPGGSPNFSVSGENLPGRIVCMGSENSFYITFTGEQQGELTKIKIYLDEDGDIPDFEFILVYNECLPATELETITEDESWSNYELKDKDYLVSQGVTVTVTGEAAMADNSDIFIDLGGKLIIDGGRLTSSCETLWNGIDVWGNPEGPQTLEYQGLVQVVNGGRIENAVTAIETGMYLSACAFPVVTQNVFHVRKAQPVPLNEAIYCGLYLDQCTGYQVEENFFYTFFDEEQREDFQAVGLVVNNSGPENNEIYNNTFDGLYAGLIAQEVNRNTEGDKGLQIKCNNFDNNIFDIALTDNSEAVTGIAYEQGSDDNDAAAPAGNRFTYIAPEQDPEPEGNYYNHCEDILYWYHSNDNGFHINPTRHTEETVDPQSEHYGLTFDPVENCPSNQSGGGPGIEDEKENMFAAGQNADSIGNLLNLLTDGGDTEGLLTEIQTSWPEDGYGLYSELIAESPYLSDTSMVEAVGKEDVLLPGMITDVLIANPQSAKSEEVMTAVDERDNQLTDDQMADIGEGRFIIGAREALELDYAYHQYQKDISKNNLIRFYRTDTLIASRGDSIIDILSFQPNLSDEFIKAFEYFKMGDSTDVSYTLDAIPDNYELTSTELLELSLYEDYFDLLLSLDSAGSRILEMDSAQIARCFNILNNASGMLAGYVRNLLVINDSLDYDEVILMPEPGLKSGKVRQWPVKTQIVENYMKIYPNPAKNVVIIEVRLKEEPHDAVIKLIDSKGIKLRSYSIQKQNEYLIIPLSDSQSGILLCQLIVRNKIVEARKLVILK